MYAQIQTTVNFYKMSQPNQTAQANHISTRVSIPSIPYNRGRRATSAGQSSRLMEEKLNEALGNGTVRKLDARKMQVHLQLGARKRVLLVESDGAVTQEGRQVYRAMGVPPPTIYPYDQPLINGKWVTIFPGAPTKKTLVVGRGNRPTAKGRGLLQVRSR